MQAGQREGLSNGRDTNFQTSFDNGYKDGFQNGFLLGKFKFQKFGQLKSSNLIHITHLILLQREFK